MLVIAESIEYARKGRSSAEIVPNPPIGIERFDTTIFHFAQSLYYIYACVVCVDVVHECVCLCLYVNLCILRCQTYYTLLYKL